MTKRKANPLFVVLLLVTAFFVVFSTIQIPVSAVSISLSPPSGPSGTVVTVTGSSFTGTGTCTITATGPSSGFVTSPTACTIAAGSIAAGVMFTVGSVIKPGTYSVQVTGTGGASGSATASYILGSTTRSISFSPSNGPIATVVSVTGIGFTTSTTCTITSSTSGLIAPGSICTTDASGNIPGGGGAIFTVGVGVAPGTYTITVTDTNALSASKSFTVLQPTITLTPQSGPVSSIVNVKSGGVKFSVGDTSCLISFPVLVPVPTPACSISNGVVTGQFQVAPGNVPNGYEVDVTGTPSGAVASAIFTVTATTTVISVTPPDGPFKTKITVQGSGFSGSDTSCQITGSLANLIAASPAPSCSVGSGKVTGTFYVGISVAVNTLATITVTGSPGGDSATVAFTIDASPMLLFLPVSPAPPGTTVIVSLVGGTQFSSGDDLKSCTISSTPGGLFSSSACSIQSGGTSLTGTFFVVANVPSGNTYTVTVKGNLGDEAAATFTVAPPVVGPAIFLSPSDGPIKTKVTVTGTGFPGADTSCVLSASATLFSGSPAPTCSIGSGKITASFTVATGAPAIPIIVTVTSSSGASAFETFTVDATPQILLNGLSVLSASPGTTVIVSLVAGTFFSSGDTSSCTLSSTPGGVFQSSACVLTQSPQSLAGTFFVIANVPTGSSYTITVKGSLGDTSLGATLMVVAAVGPQLHAVPQDGPRGTRITLQGSSYSGRDTTCIITSTPADIIAAPATCTVSTTGTFTTQFTVSSAAVPLGFMAYTITVTGSSGDIGTAGFTVDETPTLTFTPASPQAPGQTVQVSLTIAPNAQFSSGDTSCSISSLPAGLFFSSNCHLGSAGTDLTGTFFLVATVPTASSYTVVVTGNLGDTGVGTFQVTFAPTLTTTPFSAEPGATVTYIGTGLILTDTSCTLTSNIFSGLSIVTSPTCSISSGTATGSFIVNPNSFADGSPWTLTVTGNPASDIVTTSFTVVPNITLTPTNGVASSTISMKGAGFSSSATTCTLSSIPVILLTASSCNLQSAGTSGKIFGGFTVNPASPAGTYVVTATDNGFPESASTTFTVGTPNAQVTLTPNTITPPQSGSVAVGVSGFGFNGGDTVCTLTVTAPVTGSCTISGGTAGGTVTVPSGTAAGLYLITLTGNTGDFASNYLGVNAITTAISTTSSTTTSTTATTTSTLTSTTSISFSLTTTTFTSTGPTTQVFTQGTLTTVSGITSVTSTTVGFTTYLITQTTTTTTTKTFGQAINPSISDELGFFVTLLLVVSFLFRRLPR